MALAFCGWGDAPWKLGRLPISNDVRGEVTLPPVSFSPLVLPNSFLKYLHLYKRRQQWHCFTNQLLVRFSRGILQKIYIDFFVWYESWNFRSYSNIIYIFKKYLWVKYCIKIYILLFKYWKLLFKQK